MISRCLYPNNSQFGVHIIFLEHPFNEKNEPKVMRSSNTNTNIKPFYSPIFTLVLFNGEGIIELMMTWVTNVSAEASFMITRSCWLEGGKFSQSKTHCFLAIRLKKHLWQSPCFRGTKLALFCQITTEQRELRRG